MMIFLKKFFFPVYVHLLTLNKYLVLSLFMKNLVMLLVVSVNWHSNKAMTVIRSRFSLERVKATFQTNDGILMGIEFFLTISPCSTIKSE